MGCGLAESHGCECPMDPKVKQMTKALELWNRFWDDMPKGQLGKIVCDIGILNQAFLETRKALGEANVHPNN